MVVSYNSPHCWGLWQAVKEVIARVLDTTTDEIKVKETCKGSFNTIICFQIGKENFAIRIRIRESDFGFEKIAKEPFAILTLNNHNLSDRELGFAIQELYQRQYCDFMENFFVGKLYYSDWSKRFDILPYTFSIYEWKKGKPLYSIPTSEYFKAAGKLLAKLHQKTFQSYYSSILDIGSKPVSIHDNMLSTIKAKYKEALINGGSKVLLDKLIKWINCSIYKLELSYTSVFCHYDFSGSNLIVNEDKIAISAIDFDNWKVSICEDDFPKLFHWTIIDPVTQKRHSSPKHIEDFIQGYRSEGGIVNEYLLRLKEAEWLLRVYAHSLCRELTSPDEYKQSSFPSSHCYEKAISTLLQIVY